MCHNIVENPTEDSEISPERFEEQIKRLSDEGYIAVLMQDLVDYVEKGKELPEKPICITFDDGYLREYDEPLNLIEQGTTIFNSLVQQSGCPDELKRLAKGEMSIADSLMAEEKKKNHEDESSSNSSSESSE